MSNLTSIGVISGIPVTGTGTVSTLDGLMANGVPVTGLPTGANNIGNVSITAMPSVALGTSTSVIGTVNAISSGLPTGANTIGAVASIVANVNLGTSTNFIGSINSISSGLPTGANTIGAVTNAPANNKIGIVQIGNSTGGVIDNFGSSGNQGNIAGVTANVTVSVNNFPTVYNFTNGLPTGANTIGQVSGISSNVTLATSNNTIGVINAISAGLPTGANVIGGVTLSGNLAGVTANVTVSVNNFPTVYNFTNGLPTGANTIGTVNVSGNVAGITANVTVSVNNFPTTVGVTTGIPTGANTIGAVTLSGNLAGVTANVALGTSTNFIGSINALSSGLPTGANTIGSVILAIANNKMGIVQIGNSSGGVIDSFGQLSGNIAGCTANVTVSVNNFPTTFGITTGIPTGANTIGSVAAIVANVTLAPSTNFIGSVNALSSGLPTGANTIGGVTLVGNVAGVTANVTVSVNNFPTTFGVTTGIPTGANTIGSVAAIVANVTLAPSTNFIGSINALSSGLPTGANTIGSVILAIANNKMGIVQIGNSTGGVIDSFGGSLTGNVAGITANIFLGAATNVIGSVNAIVSGLPTGANTIGAISAIGSNVTLAPSTNMIGNVNINILGQNLASVSVPVTLNSDPDVRPTTANITIIDSVSTSTLGFSGVTIFTGAPSGGSFLSQAINGQQTVGVNLKGPWSGNVSFEISKDSGVTWVATPMIDRGTGNTNFFASANGQFLGDCSTATNFRVRATAAIAGNCTTTMLFSQQGSAVQILNPLRIIDNISGQQLTIKPASTAALATDPAIVVALSPNSVNPDGQTTMSASAPVVIASDQSAINVVSAGDIASGVTDSGNPVKLGVVARTTNPTAVTAGQRVNVLGDKVGRIIAVGAIRTLKGVGGNTFTSITTSKNIIPAIAAVFTDLYGIIIENTSVANTEVLVSDGTVILPFMVPAQDTRGFMLPVDSAVPATTLNTVWTANCTTSVASVKITTFYVQNI